MAFNSISRSVLVLVFALSSVFTSLSASAADMSPKQLVEGRISTVLNELKDNHAALESDKNRLHTLVENATTPLFDLPRISKLVLSKNWKKATESQRQRFQTAFKDNLITTYSGALLAYTGKETITYNEPVYKERKGRKFANVRSSISIGNGSDPINVDYAFLENTDGEWKIYNMVINGLNMVTSYRKTFNEAIKRQGLDGVIDNMNEKIAKRKLG